MHGVLEQLSFIWDVRGYFFWLLVVSVTCFLAERLFSWRRSQRALRPELGQDIFFLVFNGHYFSILIAGLSALAATWVTQGMVAIGLPQPTSVQLLAPLPLPAQFFLAWLIKDFIEWCVHNALHRIGFLWQFHKLHHSIRQMDFIGNFRFHFMEPVIYGCCTWLPVALLGAAPKLLLPLAVVTTLIGHLNHANLPWHYGPLRYVFNSPRMHIWHHDVVMHKPSGQNFGITLSLFDWIFGTAYWPGEPSQPSRLGFEGDEHFPGGLVGRFFFPLSRLFRKPTQPSSN